MIEGRCSPTFTLDTFGTQDIHGGMIHGRVVNFFVQGIQQGWHEPYAATDRVQVRTNYSNGDVAASLVVCSTTMGQWNFAWQRKAIADTLIIHFRNHKSVKSYIDVGTVTTL